MIKGLVSVIVPVYNVAKFLPDCVDSIRRQTYRDLEILLIDDGSQDTSGQICDAFAKQDSRVKVVHQENGGVSMARNQGLALAQGEYIAFCDSDDEMHPEMLSKMVADLQAQKVAMVMCGYLQRNRRGNVCHQIASSKIYELANEDDLYECLYSPLINASAVWNKLFTARSLQGFKFDPQVSWGEDQMLVHDYLLTIKKFYYHNEMLYIYNYKHSHLSQSLQQNYIAKQLLLNEHRAQFIEQCQPSQKILQAEHYVYIKNLFAGIYLERKTNPRKVVKQHFEQALTNPRVQAALTNFVPHGLEQRIVTFCLRHRWFWLIRLMMFVRQHLRREA